MVSLSELTANGMSVRVVYTAHARAPLLAAQRRAGPGVKGGGQGMRGISLIAYKMPFASVFGSESYRCDARHRNDARKEKNSQSRTRSVRVRSFAHSAIEGQRGGFPKLRTRACACGDLPSMGKLRQRVRKKKWRVWVAFTFFILLLLLRTTRMMVMEVMMVMGIVMM